MPSAARSDDRDFVPSLRLLVECERYSLTDIGPMFGVSRARVGQWCLKYGIVYPDMGRGLHSVRIWNDELFRFQPVRKRALRRKNEEHRRIQRKEQTAKRRVERQAKIVKRLIALRANLERDPTLQEMAVAITGQTIPGNSAGGTVIGRWNGSRLSTPSNYALSMAEICSATGIRIRPLGGAGHIIPPRDNPAFRWDRLKGGVKND